MLEGDGSEDERDSDESEEEYVDELQESDSENVRELELDSDNVGEPEFKIIGLQNGSCVGSKVTMEGTRAICQALFSMKNK